MKALTQKIDSNYDDIFITFQNLFFYFIKAKSLYTHIIYVAYIHI